MLRPKVMRAKSAAQLCRAIISLANPAALSFRAVGAVFRYLPKVRFASILHLLL
jgi:hypothetical protein